MFLLLTFAVRFWQQRSLTAVACLKQWVDPCFLVNIICRWSSPPACQSLHSQTSSYRRLWSCKGKGTGKTQPKFCAYSLHPSSAMLIMEIVFISSSVCSSRGTPGKNKRGLKPNSQCPSVTHTWLCMKPHKHLFLWFVKARVGSSSSSVWSQCCQVCRELWSHSWGMGCSPLQALCSHSAIQLLTEKATAASHPSQSRKPSVQHVWHERWCGSQLCHSLSPQEAGEHN